MTKEYLKDYFHKSLFYNSRTSYKFYFLKSIIYLCYKKDTLHFEDIGLEMIVQSWNDLSNSDYVFPSLDRLKSIKIDMMRNLSLLEYYEINELRKTIANIDNNCLDKYIREITSYCPYLFLSHGQWNNQLKGMKNYHQKHILIQKLSQNESCPYEVYDDMIILNSEYFDLVIENYIFFTEFAQNELEDFLKK